MKSSAPAVTIAFLLLVFPCPVQATGPVLLDGLHDSYSLGKNLQYLEDPGKTWTLRDVTTSPLSGEFRESHQEVVNHGITTSAYWVRFTVESAMEEESDWLLVYDLPIMESIDLYFPDAGGGFEHRRGGIGHGITDKDTKSPDFIHRLKIEPGEKTTLYMRFQTEASMLIALSLWDPHAYEQHKHREFLLLGVGGGIILVLVCYNFFLFLSIRDRAFLYYVLFLLTFGLYQTGVSGMLGQDLWPEASWTLLTISISCGALAQFFGLAFIRSFLQTREYIPRVDTFVLIVMGLSLVSAISIYPSHMFGNFLANVTGILAFIALIVLVLVSWMRGRKGVGTFALSWVFFILGGFLFVLTALGVIELNLVTKYGFFFGYCLGGVLLSIALGGRLRSYQEQYLSENLERCRVEKEMKESQNKLRILLEESRDVVLMVDPESGRILDADGKVHSVLGYDNEDLVGRDFYSLFPKDPAPFTKRDFERLSSRGALFKARNVLRRDGSSCPVDFTASEIPWIGGKGVLTTLRDVTARRAAEESLLERERQYRLHFEAASDLIYLLDSQFRLTHISPSVERILGYRAEEIVGRPFFELELLTPETLDQAMSDMERVMTGERIPSEEYEFIARDGSKRMAEVSGAPLFQNGRVVSAISVARDVTERNRFVEELERYRDHLEELVNERTLALQETNKELQGEITKRSKMEEELLKTQKLESLGILAGGIAHDFNNVLTGILSNISVIKIFGELDSDLKQRLLDAEKACLLAKELTQQLLTFAKGGLPVKKAVSVMDLLKESTEFALRGSNVRCELSIPQDIGSIDVDEGQLRQVIHNLIINADQAMPRGGTIRVAAEKTVVTENDPPPIPPGDYVDVSIRDEGVGIPKGDLPRIFDPFYTTKHRGSGLGLTTSFSIVQKHGGAIQVESETGEGTTFHIFLPVSSATPVSQVEKEHEPATGKGKVLIVDDDEYIRRSSAFILERLGYETAPATDGGEAVAQYRQASDRGEPFDLVIMDLTIPGGMGGKEAVKEILGLDREARVIVASGYSNDPVMSDFRQYGFCGVVVKPFRIEDLAGAVHEAINGG